MEINLNSKTDGKREDVKLKNKKVLEYIELDSIEKEARNRKTKIKKYVQKYLLRCKRLGYTFPEISFSERDGSSKYHDDLILDWIKKNYSDGVFKSILKETIDYEKLQQAFLLGHIDLREMPEECIDKSEKQLVLRVTNGKSSKKTTSS